MGLKTVSTRLLAGAALTVATLPIGAANAGNAPFCDGCGSLPPAQPGECYARVKVPAQYRTETQQVVVAEGYERVEVDQPHLISSSERIMIKEAGVRYEVRQPRWESRPEKVLIRPGYHKLEVTPPRFSTVTETVQISQPRLVWKRGNPGALAAKGYKILSIAQSASGGSSYGHGSSGGSHSGQTSGYLYGTADTCGATCEIWCLVEEPGLTKTVEKKVVSQRESVRKVAVPPKYKTVNKEILVDRGGVTEIPVAAQYDTILTEKVISPGSERRVPVPPQMGTIEKKVLVTEEKYEWIRVICDPNSSKVIVRELQTLLSNKGYYSGSIDGIMGKMTQKGLARYQADSGIPHQGYLTTDTLNHLRGHSYGATSGYSGGSSYGTGTGYTGSHTYGSGSYSSGSYNHSGATSDTGAATSYIVNPQPSYGSYYEPVPAPSYSIGSDTTTGVYGSGTGYDLGGVGGVAPQPAYSMGSDTSTGPYGSGTGYEFGDGTVVPQASYSMDSSLVDTETGPYGSGTGYGAGGTIIYGDSGPTPTCDPSVSQC